MMMMMMMIDPPLFLNLTMTIMAPVFRAPKTIPSLDVLLNAVKAQFSLAGVQMKLSVMKNIGKGGGLTLPMDDEQGRYIANCPSTAFPGVSETEFANLALAAAIGMEVPECELVEKSDFEGVPEEFNTLSEGKVLLVKRFDRGAEWREDTHRGFRSGLRCLSLAQI